MRRLFSWLPLITCHVLALHLLTASALNAQEWNLGPYIDLPKGAGYSQPASMVLLDDGHVVLAALTVTQVMPQEFETLYLTLDPDKGSVVTTWTRPGSPLRPIAIAASGEQLMLIESTGSNSQDTESELWGVLQDPVEGDDASSPFRIDSPEFVANPTTYDLARLHGGDFVTVWQGLDLPEEANQRISFQRFDAEGNLIGEAGLVASVLPEQLRVIPSRDGGFLVAWRMAGQGSQGRQVLGRLFDADGLPSSPIQELVPEEERAVSFEIAAFQNGMFFVVWAGPSGITNHQLHGRRLDTEARPLPEELELAPVSLTNKSGERAIGDLQGRIWMTWTESDGMVYVRHVHEDGSLSNILPISTRESGREPFNPQLAVNADGRALISWTELVLQDASTAQQARSIEFDNSCMESDTLLCLHQGRFQIEVDWTDHVGDTGRGRVVPFRSTDSGLFWFFNKNNWEVMVKVINGCYFNGFYWIFSAATTDVAYDLKVTDTATGLEQIYSNGLGDPAPANTDTMALMSCDHGPP